MMESDDLRLCFVNKVGEESDGKKRYEFIFTDNIDEVWGEGFEYKPSSLVGDMMPYDEYKTDIRILKTDIKFDLVQDNSCFGMQDCIDGIVSVCYENIDDYDEYPEEGRLVFMFGESLDEVERKIAMKNMLFEVNKN